MARESTPNSAICMAGLSAGRSAAGPVANASHLLTTGRVQVTPGGVTATAARATGTTLRPPGQDGQRARIAPIPGGRHAMPAEPVPVTPPKHPLPALTSYELRDYRRQLERAIEGISPGAPVQAALRAKLDAVGRAGRPRPNGRRCVSPT